MRQSRPCWLPQMVAAATPRTVPLSALQCGDLILSTTGQLVSRFTRFQTQGPVSHAIFYAGSREVVDSTLETDGVKLRPVKQALEGATVAMVMRRRGLDEAKRQELRRKALSFVGRPYDLTGLNSAGFAARKLTEFGICVALPWACLAFAVNASERRRDAKFFCSELVARVFEICGVPILDSDPSYTNPNQLVDAPELEYLGHIQP